MNHPYFFESARWAAEGLYTDAGSFPLHGEAHSAERALDAGRLGCPKPLRFTKSYTISLSENSSTLHWASFNPALGTLRGTFKIAGSAIISFYRSEDGLYSGTETLIRKDASLYENYGISFKAGVKMSSREAALRRLEA